MATAGSVTELWLYPVKGCRGVKVASARLGRDGLEYDRAFCIVDLDGIVVTAREAISMRKMPALATISTELTEEGRILTLSAPGMSRIKFETAVPTDAPQLTVDASGRSTTTDGGWKLGELQGRLLPLASQWVSEYLNRASGKSKSTRYALVRCVAPLAMESYPPIFPLIAKAKREPEYAERFKGHGRRFMDFAPLLLVSEASAGALSDLCGAAYPINSFRGNVVVGGTQPWEEETWADVALLDANDGTRAADEKQVDDGMATDAATSVPAAKVVIRTVKACPRCTVPCRAESTGEFIFKEHKLKLWHVLKSVFPLKFSDPEWGTWSGAFFGIYCGGANLAEMQWVTISVGDEVRVLTTRPWDAHLSAAPRRSRATLLATLIAAVVLAVALGAALVMDHM